MKKNSLTIIFMKDTSQPITFEVSFRYLILLLVLFILCASTYAYFMKGYFSLHQNNEELTYIVSQLKTEIGKLQNKIDRLSVPEPAAEKVAMMETTEKTAKETAIKAEKPEKPLGYIATGSEVRIKSFNIRTDKVPGCVSFSFVLDKIVKEDIKTRGYVFIVLKNNRSEKIFSSFPAVEFKNGVPVDYHRGELYSIKRFKHYSGDLKLDKAADTLEIIVYSDEGELVLRSSKPVRGT